MTVVVCVGELPVVAAAVEARELSELSSTVKGSTAAKTARPIATAETPAWRRRDRRIHEIAAPRRIGLSDTCPPIESNNEARSG